MSEKKSDQQFLNEVKQELDDSCERLDAQTLSRLNHIRHQVLEGAIKENRFSFYQRPLLSGGALAFFTLVLAVSFNFNSDSGNDADIALSELEDIEMLTTEDSFELYEEMEFYQWLSMNDDF